MSDTPVVATPKPRGFAAHKPDCGCRFCRRKRGEAVEPVTRNKKAKSQGVDPIGTKDEFDRKLDHFQYTMDESEQNLWEHNDEISPLSTPKDIKTSYPNLTFHWVSQSSLSRRGKGYNGWELFSDKNHPDGVKRGNDLFLAAMPTTLAEKRRQFVSEQSTMAVKNMFESSVEKLERAAGAIGGDTSVITSDTVAGRSVVGMDPGERATGRSRWREIPREEIHARIAKSIEERKKNKVFFT